MGGQAGQKNCPRPSHPGQGPAVMQVSNSHVQQKPLQAQLHKEWAEGELGLKSRLRSSFEVQYTHTGLFWAVVLLSPPPHSNVHVRWVQKEM